MIQRIKNWWQHRKRRRSKTQMEKARLRAQISRQERIRLESMYPNRETLPPSVWLREFIRHCWHSVALKYYPVSSLRKRAEEGAE